MRHIYENSYLTLAAALSPGDKFGFLETNVAREDYLSKPVDLADHGIPPNTVMVRQICDVRTIPAKEILRTRAWTLQETLLPPRLLVFSLTVTFDCLEDPVCECDNEPLTDPFCGDASDFRLVD